MVIFLVEFGYISTFSTCQSKEKILDRHLLVFHKVGRSKSCSDDHLEKYEIFLLENIVCQFSVPNQIKIDNAPQLKGDKIAQFCSNPHITLSPSSISHP